MNPTLLAVSHGTSSSDGDRAVAGLVAAVRDRARDFDVRAAFVDVQQPDVPTALGALDDAAPVVIVPLLLSAGFHVHVDLTSVVAAADQDVALAGALGPDGRLVDVLVHRLTQAGARAGDVVILASAGSSDPRAVDDCRAVAGMLAGRLGAPVEAAFISAVPPELGAAVRAARLAHPGRRIVVGTYLLAPGYFARLAAAAGADVTTAPLLVADEPAPAELVEIVLERFRTTSGGDG